MLYTALYMSSTRTQVYFSERQRRRLDALATQRRVALAAVVREAVDAYLDQAPMDAESALTETFGSIPNLVVPSRDEWDLGRPRRH